jgi:hypothetical protein
MIRRITLDAALAATAVLGVMLISSSVARGDDKTKEAVTAKDAFAQLKSLKGTYKNQVSDTEHHMPDHESKVTYHLTGAGSALVETDFPGTNHEMVSVYHLDGQDLRLTHYCAAGNQPRLKLDRSSSTPTKFVFVFDGGSNMDAAKDMHIHGMTMTFEKDGSVKAAWEAYMAGKSAGKTLFALSPEKQLSPQKP